MDKIGKRSVAAQQLPQLSADETAVFDALRAKGVDESLAFKATQSIRAIAGRNVTAMVEPLREELRSFKEEVRGSLRDHREEMLARLDSMERVWTSRFDSVESSLATIRWAIGLLTLIQGAVMAILVFAIQGRTHLSPDAQVPSPSALERPPSEESPAKPGGRLGAASPVDGTSSQRPRDEN
ncbi:MAG: hypothetical protein OXN89_22870 [Bryobacterales bacterium]|nr:hypothetical protein [Bryobacterales bacterium]